MNYRPEIDGLRSLAVLSVVIYHAEFTLLGNTFLPGGYLGVDVFFVISGYLITKLLLLEIKDSGTVSFLKFYERRARRLLPALFLVMGFCLMLGWFTLQAYPFMDMARSMISAVFFGSNFYFFFTTTAYGAESSLLLPFLHTWSLGIEEQFYILFPPILLASLKIGQPKSFLWILAILLTASLCYSQLLANTNPELNFFSPASRFWELGTGSLIAHMELNRRNPLQRVNANWITLPALAVLIVCMFWFDASAKHPGFISIVPVLAVGGLIARSDGKDLVGKLLSTRALVGVGLISYSIYLWHYPIFAFYREGVGEPQNLMRIILLMIVVALSAVSYFVVEKPFRNRTKFRVLQFSRACVATAIVLLTFNITVLMAHGLPGRLETLPSLKNYVMDNPQLRRDSWQLVQAKRAFSNENKTKVLIVGNSHSKTMFNMLQPFTQSLRSYDFLNYTPNPQFQLSCFDEAVAENARYQNRFFSSNAYMSADVILVSSLYADNQSCFREMPESSDLVGLENLIQKAIQDGKKVRIIGKTFHYSGVVRNRISDVYVQKFVDSFEDQDDVTEMQLAALFDEINAAFYTQIDWEQLEINSEIQEIATKFGIPFLSVNHLLCNDETESCIGITPAGEKVYYDLHHLTLEGAEFVGSLLVQSGLHRDMLE